MKDKDETKAINDEYIVMNDQTDDYPEEREFTKEDEDFLREIECKYKRKKKYTFNLLQWM